jgi:hypothetical protein
MGQAGFVSVGPVWLTPTQAEQVKAWDTINRAQALGKQEDKADD